MSFDEAAARAAAPGAILAGRRSLSQLSCLLLGFIALAFAVAGGLARLTPFAGVPAGAVALHGPLMVSGFLGTLIALERAVALGRAWAYAAPLCAGLGGLLVVLGFFAAGLGLMALGAAVLAAASGVVLARHRSLEMAALFAGALAWLLGNIAVFAGLAAVPWWIAFFALTIGGERLELMRYLARGPAVRIAFQAILAALLFAPLVPRLLGVALIALALWLFLFDLARVTVRQKALPRYVAVCLLAGYCWLAAGGALVALALQYDAALHALFVGFVLSMVFGHAPVILPAVLRTPLPYHPVLYVPLALLHVSLAVRVLVSTPLGAWGNAAAIVLFIVIAATLVLRRKLSRAGRPAAGA